MVRMKVLGVARRSGVSGKTGNEYDMTRLLVLGPIDSGTFGKMTVDAAGCEATELEAEPSVIDALRSVTQWPCECDIDVQPQMHRGGFRSVVVAVKPVAQVKAA